MNIFSKRAAALMAAMALSVLTACSDAPEPGSMAEPVTATFYEGARVIVGDGSVIENAAFGVDGGDIIAMGAAGEVDIPEGAGRVDLNGMTVMPAIVDAHVHLSATREGLIEDLQRRAWFGVGAALSMGSDLTDEPLALRGELIPGAARYRSAGTGITRPEPGRREVHWVDAVGEARQAVRTEAGRNVDLIKIWVDDRNGQYDKLTPQLYGAIIEEAHAHDLKVAAHIFNLEDAKGLLEAGVDIFAHGVRDQDIDDEFLTLVTEHPDTVLIANLPGRGVPTDIGWAAGMLSDEDIVELRAVDVEAGEAFGIQARNLSRLNQAGMTIAMGTDGNSAWAPHVEMADMVSAGMAPADVIVAATRNSAAVLGIEDMGTLQPGMSADFVVLEASPLDDITNTRRIAAVYLRGEAVDREGLLAQWNSPGEEN